MWKKIIEENEEKILEACFKADKEVYENKHMQFTLYLCEDGSLYTFGDVAGGNSQPEAAWKGEEFAIHTFCHQYWSILDDVEDSTVIDYLPEGKDYMAEYQEYLREGEEEEEVGGFVRWLQENYEEELSKADMDIFCEDICPADYSDYYDEAIESAEMEENFA